MSERPEIYAATLPRELDGPLAGRTIVRWAGLKLTGADPTSVSSSEELHEIAHRFDVLLESAWKPGEIALVAELAAEYDRSRATMSLTVVLLIGLIDDDSSSEGTAQLESLWSLARSELTAPPSPFEVAACDPQVILTRDDPYCDLLLPGSSSVSANGRSCSTLVHFNGARGTWLSLAVALSDRATSTRLRTSLLSWAPQDAQRSKVREQLDTALAMVDDPHTSSGQRFEAQRVAFASRQLLDAYEGPVYFAEVAVCGDEPVDPAVLRRVAFEIVGTSQRESLRRSSPPLVLDRTFGMSLTLPGVFRVEAPPFGRASASAVGLPARVIGSEPRVADLFPITAARSAFQWPIPWGGPVPSVPATRFEALPASHESPVTGVPIGRDKSGQLVRLDPAARSRHMHLIGVPGSGKTTLLSVLINHDLSVGAGFVMIDPHGDLASRVRAAAGECSVNLLEFGVTDANGPRICLLPGASGDEEDPIVERAVGRLIDALTSHLPENYSGPRFRSIAKAALTVLAHTKQGEPLSSASELLYDDAYMRGALLGYSGPPWAARALRNHFSQREAADIASWAASKFEDLFTSSMSQRLVGSIGEGVDVSTLVADNSQVVVTLDQSALSNLEAGLLGHVVLAGCIDAAFDRGTNAQDLFSVYVDEIHSFPARNLARGLSEGRKFGLGLVLAHQTLSQLDSSMFHTMVGHCGVDFIFRLAPEDARHYAEILSVPAASLRDQPDLHMFVRQAVRGRAAPTFSTWLDPPTDGVAW